MDSDQALIKKIQDGNSRAFKQFFDSLYPSVCTFAQKYLQDIVLAEDVAQEAFVKFWKQKERFINFKAAKGFIYTVTRNDCLNQIKTKKLHSEILSNELNTEEYFYEAITELETYRMVHQAINGLARQTRKVVLLSMNGYKNPEIAEELQVSINTVKTLKKNAYRELRSALKGHVYSLFLLHQILF